VLRKSDLLLTYIIMSINIGRTAKAVVIPPIMTGMRFPKELQSDLIKKRFIKKLQSDSIKKRFIKNIYKTPFPRNLETTWI